MAAPRARHASVLANDERYCPHCDQVIKRRTFYDHKKDFFDEDTGTWIKKVKADAGGDVAAVDKDSCQLQVCSVICML